MSSNSLSTEKKKKKHKKGSNEQSKGLKTPPEIKNAKTTDLAYDIDRYLEHSSPMSVYIPAPDLLFKMMRACIGCQSIKDLWIYNETFNPVTE